MKKILSLVALAMMSLSSAWAEDVKVTWPMGESTDGVATPATAAADMQYTVGDGLKKNGTTVCDEVTFTKFDQNTGSDKGANGASNHDKNVSMGKYVDFSFKPVGGEFTVTKVSFDVIKVGTGDPNIFVDVTDASGQLISVATDVTIRKNSESTPSMSQSFEVSGAKSGDGTVTLRIIPGKLASGKAIALANVVIEGTLVSSDTPVLNATKEVYLKVIPLTPEMQATATIALTGKNLTDGTYSTPVPADGDFTVSPATYEVSGGIVSQEFTLTFKPTASVAGGSMELTFAAGGLSAVTTVKYDARLEAYQQTVVSEETAWDWEKLTEEVVLDENTVPSINDDFVFRELEDRIKFGTFDAQSIVISKTQYPVRSKKFQNGTIKFKTNRPGVITVDFSDTGSSGDGVERYLMVNGQQTEFFSQRDGTSDRKVSDEIEVAAGEVSITGWDPTADVTNDAGEVVGKGKNVPICIYKVTFKPTGDVVEEKNVTISISNDVTVGSAVYATFCCDKDLDFSAVEGLTAYKVKKKIVGDWSTTLTGEAVLTELAQVPAGTGVLLKADAAGDYVVPFAEGSVARVTNNDLKVLTERKALADMQTVKYGELEKGPGILGTKTFSYYNWQVGNYVDVTVTGFVLLDAGEVDYLEAGTVYMDFDLNYNAGGAESEMDYPAYSIGAAQDNIPAVEINSIAELKAINESGKVQLNLNGVKVTYAKNANDANVAVIEDQSGAISIDGLGTAVQTGDDLSGLLMFNVTIADLTAYGLGIMKEIKVTDASQIVRVAGETAPVEVTDENVYSYVVDYDWRFVKFTGVKFSTKNGDHYVNIEMLEEEFPVQDLWHCVETWPADGEVVDVCGYLYDFKVSNYTAVFQPVMITPSNPDATRISSASVDVNTQAVYNLQGLRVKNVRKGLYVVDGKKVMVK